MGKGKVPRKQLLKTEDEFITISASLLQLVVRYKLQISCVLGGIIVLVGIVAGIRYFSNRTENKAFAQLNQTIEKYQSLAQKEDAAKAYQGVQAEFQQILNRYSGNKAGKLARITFANICYDSGNFDRAIGLYQKALEDVDDDIALEDLVLSGLGYAFEGKKEYPEAAKFFERIVSAPKAIMKDDALFHLGRLYAAMGNHEKSINSYKAIVADYGGSIYSLLAKEKLNG